MPPVTELAADPDPNAEAGSIAVKVHKYTRARPEGLGERRKGGPERRCKITQ